MNHALRIFPRFRAAAILLVSLGLTLGAAAQNTNIAINATGVAADPKALLDISSLSKGLLIPRMANLTSIPAPLPEGLTAYRTGGPTVRGFYIVKNGVWEMLRSGRHGWDTYGNTLNDLTDPNPDFIGTTDGKPMYLRTNNLLRMKMDGTANTNPGYISVGYPIAYNALQRLDIYEALSMYYVPPVGNYASNTNAPGVFRYQPFGTGVGNTNYRYGSLELPAVKSPSTPASVLGTTNNYPLQYAAHWGNVDGTAQEQGLAGPPMRQPKNNGWRAFENPYDERINVAWSHFREAECTAPTDSVQMPVSGTIVGSNNAVVGPNGIFVTPFHTFGGANFVSARRQYLYRATELNLEVGQALGNPAALTGLCPGGQVSKIGFYAYNAGFKTVPMNGGTVTVRNAPLGLDELNGFDNTAADPSNLSCGTFAKWPLNGAANSWQYVTISPPFVWDGSSNVLVEVAYRGNPENVASRPTQCTNAGFYASYGAQVKTLNGFDQLPDPSPLAWSCANFLNPQTRMKDASTTVGYESGKSTYRPIIKFFGSVAKAGPGGVNNVSGTGNYIYYPGALVVEDGSDTIATKIPWGLRRPTHPTGHSYYSYQGNGTISAQRGVFDDGSRLNDHVFDRAFDGRVAPGDAEHFGDQRLLPLRDLESFTRTNRHLPTMKGREDWNSSGGFSLGDITNQLWATTETHALYVTELHDKLNVIEMLTNDRPITAAEFNTARQQLTDMAQYTDAQKARLIASLRKRAPLTPLTR